MTEDDFKGLWIPREILLDNNLTLQEKVLLARICNLDNEEGCFASNQYFAEFLSVTKKRIGEIIKSLNEKQYITCKIIYKDNSKEISKRILNFCHEKYLIDVAGGTPKNVYTSPEKGAYPPPEKVEGVLPKMCIPSPEKCVYPPPKKVEDNKELNKDFNKDFSNIKNIFANANIQKGSPFCSSAEPVKLVKNEFEDAETAQSNTLTIEDQIKAQMQRYNAEQLKVIDEFFNVLKHTRKSCKLAEGVVLKIYQDWNKHEVQKIMYGLDKYINNPNLHDKNEKYVLGIIRNSTAAEINTDTFNNKNNNQQTSKKPCIKPNRFINYEQRDYDFDKMRQLERELLDRECMAD